jgi:DNA-binding winged helix-turn-helix (wHTH) protein
VRAEKVQQVEPQVLDLIIDLVEHRGRLVTRDELLERIWQGRIVSE